MSGIEPPTPCMSSKYSNQLSYTFKHIFLFYHNVNKITILFYFINKYYKFQDSKLNYMNNCYQIAYKNQCLQAVDIGFWVNFDYYMCICIIPYYLHYLKVIIASLVELSQFTSAFRFSAAKRTGT